MKYRSVMIKPASSLCNLRCGYCFYADVSNLREIQSFGMMTTETAQGIINKIYGELVEGDSVTFAFQGGEPTMAGLAFFRSFVSMVGLQPTKVAVSYALQTNGILLDAEWCLFLKEHRFLVGLSLDGTAEYHNANRVDASGKGTFARVMQVKGLLEQYGVDYNILSVLTNEIARHPQQVWSFVKKQKIEYIQFIPCLDGLESGSGNAYALTPARFASFYKALFPLWLQEYQAGNYISVKLFDDLVNLLARGMVGACGLTGQCQVQFVVEADGGAYPCDFYVLDQYRLGDLSRQTIPELLQAPQAEAFLHRADTLPKLCTGCEYRAICQGGCKRMRQAVCCQEQSDYCGYQDFLEATLPLLQSVARKEASYRR